MSPFSHQHGWFAWHVSKVVKVSHLSGIPVHVGVLVHEQFAARQVELVVLAEQAGGVPAQSPAMVVQEHPLPRHGVMLTLLEQVAGVPPQASVALFHVHPVCAEQSDKLV